MENMKFRIKDKDQADRLQKVLFELGYTWVMLDTQLINFPITHLFTQRSGYLTHMTNNHDYYFEEHTNLEADTEAFIAKHTPENRTQPEGRTVSFEEAMQLVVEAGGVEVPPEDEGSKKVTSDGLSTSYYKLVVKTASGNFECETTDIIYALVGGDFGLGNALKALRRIYEASQGRGKDGISMEYDANKINYFVKDFVERSRY